MSFSVKSWTSRPQRRRAISRLAVSLALGFGLGVAPAVVPSWVGLPLPTAHAEEPLTSLDGQVTDPHGALGAGAAEVQSHLDAISEGTDYRLFVVFVETFDDLTPAAWAQQTAINTGLEPHDILLAVATIDRLFGISVADNSGIPQSQLNNFFTNTENAFTYAVTGASDWSTATVRSADYLRSQLAPAAAASWTQPLITLAAVAIGGTILLALLTRRRHTIDNAAIVEVDSQDFNTMSTDDLQRRATASLIGVDDAIKTDEQELNFAIAEFGQGETTKFAEALNKAKAEVRTAFQINQQITDANPETEDERRAQLTRIIQICDGAAATLSEQTTAFDSLRKLSERAPELLDKAEAQAGAVEKRIPGAHAEVERLTTLHSEAAVASVAKNPHQATALLKDAKDAITTGRDAISQGNKGGAVVAARGAQTAVDQAKVLVSAVSTAGTDLSSALEQLPGAITSLEADITEAERLAKVVAAAGGQPVEPHIESARQAISVANAVLADGGDPIAALSLVQRAEADIDSSLMPVRARDEADTRARALLPQAIDRVTLRIQSISDFISTRRQLVGHEARTRLSEAVRLLNHGQSIASSNPQEALRIVNQAERYADQAAAFAQQDLDSGMGVMGGGSDLTGMMLGGILMGQMLGGGMRRYPMRAGWGGYSGWGGYGGFGGMGVPIGGFGVPVGRPMGGGLGGSFGGGFGGSMGGRGGLGGMGGGFGGRGGFGGMGGGGFGGGMGGRGGMGGGFGGGMGRR